MQSAKPLYEICSTQRLALYVDSLVSYRISSLVMVLQAQTQLENVFNRYTNCANFISLLSLYCTFICPGLNALRSFSYVLRVPVGRVTGRCFAALSQ